MLCYQCDKSPQPGGLRYGVRQAVGVCHDCGAGVCAEHGVKRAGEPLLCTDCAAVRRGKAAPGRAA